MATKYKKNTTTKYSKFLVAIPVVLVVAFALEATGVTDFYKKKVTTTTSPTTSDTINYNPPSEEEKAQVEANKTDDTKIGSTQSPSTAPSATDKNVVIASATQGEAMSIVVQTELYGLGWQNCTLTLTQGAQKIVKNVETLYQQNFSTCLGFSVPYSELKSSGEWQVELSAKNSDNKDHTAAATIVRIQ